jgi:hypothetical protein
MEEKLDAAPKTSDRYRPIDAIVREPGELERLINKEDKGLEGLVKHNGNDIFVSSHRLAVLRAGRPRVGTTVALGHGRPGGL